MGTFLHIPKLEKIYLVKLEKNERWLVLGTMIRMKSGMKIASTAARGSHLYSISN